MMLWQSCIHLDGAEREKDKRMGAFVYVSAVVWDRTQSRQNCGESIVGYNCVILLFLLFFDVCLRRANNIMQTPWLAS